MQSFVAQRCRPLPAAMARARAKATQRAITLCASSHRLKKIECELQRVHSRSKSRASSLAGRASLFPAYSLPPSFLFVRSFRAICPHQPTHISHCRLSLFLPFSPLDVERIERTQSKRAADERDVRSQVRQRGRLKFAFVLAALIAFLRT